MIPDIVKLLVKAASLGPSADNSQPLSFHWQQTRLSLVFDPERCNDQTYVSAGSHASLLTLGAAIENIVQVGRATGLELDAPAMPKTPNGQLSAVFELDPLRRPAADCNQHPVFNRHTNRLPYQKTPLSDSCLQQIEAISSQEPDGPSVRIFLKGKQSAHLIDLLKQASMLRFQTRETNEWLAHTLRFTPAQVEQEDGLDIATLGLPPGGTALLKLLSNWKYLRLLNKLGFYRLLTQMEVQPLKQAPALLVISGNDRSSEASVAAGRLLERVWVALNADGVAVQPFYVVTDQLLRQEQGKIPPHLASDAKIFAKEVSATLNGRFPHMVLRIGYPTKEPVRARRYPLEKLLRQTQDPGGDRG